MQDGKIFDVFPSGEVGIQTAGVREDADPSTGLDRLVDEINTVDLGGAGIGFEKGGEHTQRGGLTGTVRPQKPGDATILGTKTDASHGLDGTKAFAQLVQFDHGAGPASDNQKGGKRLRSRQLTSSAPGSVVSKKSARIRSMQRRPSCPCPSPGRIRCRAFARVTATRAASAGGVTGSRLPDNSNTGSAVFKGS